MKKPSTQKKAKAKNPRPWNSSYWEDGHDDFTRSPLMPFTFTSQQTTEIFR